MIITVPRKKEKTTMEIEDKNLPAVNTQVGTIAALTDYINNADPQQTIGKLLKFSKGEFLLGQDAEVIAEGTTYVVAADDMVLTGFIRWDNGKPVEHKLVRISSGEPLFRREELGHNDRSAWPKDAKGEPRDVWQAAIYIPVIDEVGELSTFTSGSSSGIKSVNRLLRRYVNHAARHPEQYPLVSLKKSFFVHSDKWIGKIFFPDFEPAGWVDRAEFVEAMEIIGVNVVEILRPRNFRPRRTNSTTR